MIQICAKIALQIHLSFLHVPHADKRGHHWCPMVADHFPDQRQEHCKEKENWDKHWNVTCASLFLSKVHSYERILSRPCLILSRVKVGTGASALQRLKSKLSSRLADYIYLLRKRKCLADCWPEREEAVSTCILDILSMSIKVNTVTVNNIDCNRIYLTIFSWGTNEKRFQGCSFSSALLAAHWQKEGKWIHVYLHHCFSCSVMSLTRRPTKPISCPDKTFKCTVNAFGYLLASLYRVNVFRYNVGYMQLRGSGDLEMWYDIQLSTCQYLLDVPDLHGMGILSACSTFSILYYSKLAKKTGIFKIVLQYCSFITIQV